ncbi:MAG: polyhydroxyalkanoate synthesis regulator DNA-binding domain-containing protein [Polyangiaceae bacterium]
MSTENPTSGGAEAPSARVIKRYSNRKLYDTKDSRYVTLLQIAELVRSGEEVRIIDNTTKEDLTEVTLAQIIFEEQKSKGQRNVPIQTLKDMIQARTEKVLSDLREGPIGRLIPPRPADSEPEPTPPSKPEPVPTAPPAPPTKGRLVDQARVTLEDWQHKIDDRIRAIVPSLKPWHELESEVRRLRERVDALEAELRRRDEED